jgi:SAM-dependent methyltransferase
MEALGYPAVRRRALDFGCGAGRVTQALASWFDCVVGVDVSPNMIELAGSYNRVGARCSYTVNGDDDLRQFESSSFDLVYSKIVLQHVPPQIARRYVREFVRLLAPGGLALFQLPSRLRSRSRAYAAMYGFSLAVLRSVGRPRLVEMHGVARSVVERDIAQCGGEVLAVSADGSAGPAWESYLYAVTKGRREMRG